MNTVFCEQCRDVCTYTIIDTELTGNIKGKEYKYSGKEAHCGSCGSLVFVPEINDSNLQALYDAYRLENNIVSLQTIRAIPEKYSIGKRPLSLMLGWGEQTFTRYFDGDIPSKQYSDTLERIYNDTRYYSKLLDQNQDRIGDAAYAKSRRAVDDILSDSVCSADSKIVTVAKYIIYRCGDITHLSLQKALYYAQGFYHAFHKTFLFPNDCQAWVHGPVYRDIYFLYRNYQYNTIDKIPVFDESAISQPEKEVLDSIIENVCCYSGKILERFTHSETPWVSTRSGLTPDEISDHIIDKSLIAEFFGALKDDYGMTTPSDIKKYTESVFTNSRK